MSECPVSLLEMIHNLSIRSSSLAVQRMNATNLII